MPNNITTVDLTENQMHIARELGWDSAEMLSEPVKSLIRRIEYSFRNHFSRDPVTVRILPPQTGSRSRKPFYALGNQCKLEVTRTYSKGIEHFDSNYEQILASSLLQIMLSNAIKKMTGSADDQFMVCSVVDNVVDNLIVTPENVMLIANCQNDVFISRTALSGQGMTTVAAFDDLVKDYVKIMMSSHRYSNTVHTHFYLTSKKIIDDIRQSPEKAQEHLETGAIKEYREVLITPNTVPLYATESIKSKKGKNSVQKKA